MTTDILFKNARIITMAKPCRADWLAVAGGRICAMGRSPELSIAHLQPGRTVDCRGRTALPGFVDAHLHLQAMARHLRCLPLGPDQGVHTIADIQAHIAGQASRTAPGTWIRAVNYHEFDVLEKRHPHRRELDHAAPDHPLILTHRTGHAHVLNSRALAAIGIHAETGDPEGGMIDRDLHTGAPSGLLFEMGPYLADRLPQLSETELQEGIRQVDRQLLAAGVTTVHDVSAGNGPADFLRLQGWVRDGVLTPHVHMAMGMDWFLAQSASHEFVAPAPYRSAGQTATGDNAFSPKPVRVTGVKIILDETTGRLHPPQEQLNKLVAAIHCQGQQAIIHAVEEAAITAAAAAIAYGLRQRPAADHRHRIEHCAVCPADLAAVIADLGVQIVSQPGFLYVNGDRYLETVAVGKMPHLYPFATLYAEGVRPAGSSDAPVGPPAPLQALQAAVDRRARSGRRVNPGQAVTLRQALEMMTVNSSRALFAESYAGSLAIGGPADLIILDGDLEDAGSHGIDGLQVETTIVGGRVAWQRSGLCLTAKK